MKTSIKVRFLPPETHIAYDAYYGEYTITAMYKGFCKVVTVSEAITLQKNGHETLRALAIQTRADLVRQREALDKVIARLKGTDRPSSSNRA